MHTVTDDHSRVANADICTDENTEIAIGVLQRAVAWFAGGGVVERVLSDNSSAQKSHASRDACTDLSITYNRTRPYRPRTDGEIERFHRTLGGAWPHARFHDSEDTRRAAPPGRLHFYHDRPESPIGAPPPIAA